MEGGALDAEQKRPVSAVGRARGALGLLIAGEERVQEYCSLLVGARRCPDRERGQDAVHHFLDRLNGANHLQVLRDISAATRTRCH